MNNTLNPQRTGLVAAVLTVTTLAVGYAFPQWQFLLAVALSKGVVAMGLVLLLRSGLASFGQGLYYCAGAYSVGMAMTYLKWTDLAVLLVGATLLAAVLGGLLGFLLARYRDIFFAMLTLALSMILYGLLIRNPVLGGSDGFNVFAPAFFGSKLSRSALFLVTVILTGVTVWAVQRYMQSRTGRLGPAIKDNEVRVEYLGASARRNIHLNYILAAGLAGFGGGLSSFTIGHIDPDMAFWTTSGEFVFIAVLGGTRNAYAPLLGAFVLEMIRSLAYQHAPNTWQVVMGATMLALIVFLPGGLISLGQRALERRRVRQRAQEAGI